MSEREGLEVEAVCLYLSDATGRIVTALEKLDADTPTSAALWALLSGVRRLQREFVQATYYRPPAE